MADGAFDGMASWAEKETTQENWTKVEQSRAFERYLDNQNSDFKNRDAWTDKGFFNRFLSLSTTHYGMSVPFIHYQRQARAELYTSAAVDIRRQEFLESQNIDLNKSQVIFNEYPRYGQENFEPTDSIERQKIILEKKNALIPSGAAFTKKSLNDHQDIIEIFRTNEQNQNRTISLIPDTTKSSQCHPTDLSTFNDGGLSVLFSTKTGIQSIFNTSDLIGGNDFLSPFISFQENSAMTTTNKQSTKSQILTAHKFSLKSEICETAPNIREVKLSTQIDLQGKKQKFQALIDYRIWKDIQHPYLFIDVHAELPFTVDETAPDHVDRRFRKHVDWRWQEVALSQLKPTLGISKTLNVWKMNYEGLISSYKINQDEFNKKNKNLDSLNNHLTPGWMAVSNGKRGILIAFNAMKRSSFGAVPLRVRTDEQGLKTFSMNPFGTYFGKQLNYAHVGGEKLGTLMANMGAPYVRPNAPSFMGKTISYELMIVPYEGDQPSEELIKTALSFAYPAIATVALPEQKIFEDGFTHAERFEVQKNQNQLSEPLGLAATTLDQSAAVTWANPSSYKADGYQIIWRKLNESKWQSQTVGGEIRTIVISGLENGDQYEIKGRSIKGGKYSDFSKHQIVKPASNIVDVGTNSVIPNLRMIYLAAAMIIKNQTLSDPDRAEIEKLFQQQE